MKKILILMSFILPVAMIAQTRPAPKKVQERNIPTKRPGQSKEDFSMDRPVPYSYMVLQIIEEKVKKEASVLTYSVESFDDRYSTKIENSIQNKKSVVQVLNFLGAIGWQLVSIDNGRYYFKSNSIGIKKRK